MDDVKLCVWCRRRAVEPAYRPFCSERCRLLDLRNWVDERYRVPGDPTSMVPPEHDGPDPADDRLDEKSGLSARDDNRG